MNAPEIAPDTIRAYEEDGATVVRGLVGVDWLDRLRAAVDRDIADPAPFVHGYTTEDGRGRFHGNLRVWQSDEDFRAFCLDSHLPAVAARFFGSGRVNLLYDQLFVKEAETGNRTRWHNDQPYWAVRGWQVMSFWIALDPVTQDSGALEFVRGSHKWGKWFQPERFGKTTAHDDYERNPDYVEIPDIEAARGDYDILSWDLEPGDAYAFHALTVHGAGGNDRADRRRRGYTVRYTGDDAVYDSRPGTNAHLRSERLKDGDPLGGEQFPLVWTR